MTDEQLHEANVAIRKNMNSAAAAVLGAMIRSLHSNTNTRILLTAMLTSHKVEYELKAGDYADVQGYGDECGLKTVSETELEVAS